MDIFSSNPGAVVAVDGPGTALSLFLEGWQGYAPFKSIITGFGIHTQDGVQFQHSLRDFIYVYVFGERITEVTLSGLSFAHVCERLDNRQDVVGFPQGQSTFRPNWHGLEYVMGYYNTYRVSTTGTPLTLVFGLNTILYGFLVGTSIGFQDTEKLLSTFELTFRALPQTTLLAQLK